MKQEKQKMDNTSNQEKYSWFDFEEKIYNEINTYLGGGYAHKSFNKLEPLQKNDFRKDARNKIKTRLLLIFDNMNPKSGSDFFSEITELEVSFYIYLIKSFPDKEIDTVGGNLINPYQDILFDKWDKISYSQRKTIFDFVFELKKDTKTIAKYVLSKKRCDINREVKLIEIKLLHPKYYQTMRNIIQLNELTRFSIDDILKNIDEKTIDSLQKQTNDLLDFIESKTELHIKSPYSKKDFEKAIDEQIIEKGLSITSKSSKKDGELDFKNQIEKALKRKK